jgi:hypothetical protein
VKGTDLARSDRRLRRRWREAGAEEDGLDSGTPYSVWSNLLGLQAGAEEYWVSCNRVVLVRTPVN